MENNRRLFLKNLGLAGAAAAVTPSVFAAETKSLNFLKRTRSYSENKTIRIALIGAGGIGVADANTALSQDHVEMISELREYKNTKNYTSKRNTRSKLRE